MKIDNERKTLITEDIRSKRGKLKTNISSILFLSTAGLFVGQTTPIMADEFAEALTNGKTYGDIRLRYEMVEQDNGLEDADALTVRTRLGYKTGSYKGFLGVLEFEDVRVAAAVEDFNSTQNGKSEFSVVADPESTELDQAYVHYNGNSLTSRLGRQVITLDNHRHVGDVGWRQDRQTFDGIRFDLKPMKNLNVMYAYLDERNRIFAEAGDIDSKDHLVNASYKTPLGKVSGYAYLLEVDNDTDNALDTVGIRFDGSTKIDEVTVLYTAEFASQEYEIGMSEAEAEYLFIEGGVTISGVTAKLGYELLGSDDGAYGFSTPLATLHKFNGWADQFLATPVQGLEDIMLTLSGKLAGGKLVVVFHEFSADESSATVDDLGSEIDVLYAKKFGKNYNAGIKYAAYSAEDIKVDTDKLWVWLGLSF